LHSSGSARIPDSVGEDTVGEDSVGEDSVGEDSVGELKFFAA